MSSVHIAAGKKQPDSQKEKFLKNVWGVWVEHKWADVPTEEQGFMVNEQR